MSAIEIFLSYSHKDENLRQELEEHLNVLQVKGVIKAWNDRRISAGSEWEKQIHLNLQRAKIILLLVSADYISSDYCFDIEVKQAMERHRTGNCIVVPVILRPCDWESMPFGKLQAVPKDARPVTSWENRDEAFADIAITIHKLALSMTGTESGAINRTKRKFRFPHAIRDMLLGSKTIGEPSYLKQESAREKRDALTKRKAEEGQKRKEQEKLMRKPEEEKRKRTEVEAKRKQKEADIGNIFISYSQKDQTYVRELSDYLEDEGLSVWVDYKIEHGAHWWRTIVANIHKCAGMVVVMTPESEESDMVEKEYFLAKKFKKPLFPLLLEGDGFPYFINQHHHNVRDKSMPPKKFLASLRRLAVQRNENEEESKQEKDEG